jgi:integrase/recombinase XerD
MSQLQKAMEEYLAVRRALGFKLRDTGGALHSFVAFMDQAKAPVITTKLALQWAQQPVSAQPAQWATRLGMVSRFARYLSATDPRTEIPPQGLLPYRFHRKAPYIYSHHQRPPSGRSGTMPPGKTISIQNLKPPASSSPTGAPG